MSTTRRHFLTQAAWGAGSLLLPSRMLASSQQEKKLGVALVGLGNYSTHQLGPALRQTQHCYLAGIVTGTPEKERRWMQEYGIPKKNVYTYQTFDQIADNPDIDIVYVVLPNFMHAEYSIRAAQAGKHVICEKPLAMNVAEADRMIQACQDHHVLLSVGYRLYFEPHHRALQRLAQEQAFGPLKVVETSFGFPRPDSSSWRLDKKIGGGGAIMDLGVYAIQGARRTVGQDPVSVTAQAFTFDKEHFVDIYETVFWQFEFPGGVVSQSSTTYSSYVDRLYVAGEGGWGRLEPAFNATGAGGETHEGPLSLASPEYQQVAQMDEFAQSIRQQTTPLASGQEGRKDLVLIEAILRAAETGKKVPIVY